MRARSVWLCGSLSEVGAGDHASATPGQCRFDPSSNRPQPAVIGEEERQVPGNSREAFHHHAAGLVPPAKDRGRSHATRQRETVEKGTGKRASQQKTPFRHNWRREPAYARRVPERFPCGQIQSKQAAAKRPLVSISEHANVHYPVRHSRGRICDATRRRGPLPKLLSSRFKA